MVRLWIYLKVEPAWFPNRLGKGWEWNRKQRWLQGPEYPEEWICHQLRCYGGFVECLQSFWYLSHPKEELDFLPLECWLDLVICYYWIDYGGHDNVWLQSQILKDIVPCSLLDPSLGGKASCHVVRTLKQVLSEQWDWFLELVKGLV